MQLVEGCCIITFRIAHVLLAARLVDNWRALPRDAWAPTAASDARATPCRGALRTTIPRAPFKLREYRNDKHLQNIKINTI